MILTLCKRFLAVWVVLGISSCVQTNNVPFNAESKPATAHTVALQKELRAVLPFSDQDDFEEQRRGFLAKPDYKEILADEGHVAWSLGDYDFLLQGEHFNTVHPSLLRQAILNMNYGLYEVVEDIYQVRGFDLSNITFIKGDTGWIVFDPLVSKETARAALALINGHLGERPVVAVVYSHNHADHFGGVRGVVDEAEVLAGRVPIIAPEGFMEHAIAENIYAGNAMARRLFYQYGTQLEKGPRGHVDQSIGKNASKGNIGLIKPTRIIHGDYETLVIDGVRMVFQNTPNTEAPAEMNTWLPDQKAFWAAENISGTIHNIYTLRGAPVRDALAWSKYINLALYEYGEKAEVMFSAHNWPRWGNERIQTVMRGQRDMYAHLNNQVLHLANKGITVNEIHNVYEVPESQKNNWFSRGYHGSFEHNSRAVINRYLGYWDANPATLIPLSPADAAPVYVEMMGGSEVVIQKAKKLFDGGKYLLAQELLNKVVYADPNNKRAKFLLADTFEQIGYQQESPSVRNSFLAAALELRQGIPQGPMQKTNGPDLVKAMSTSMFLDYLAIRMDATKAEGLAFTINFHHPDEEKNYVLELSNSALTNIEGFSSKTADLNVSINRSDLERYIIGAVTFEALAKEGKMSLEGDASVLSQLMALLVEFDPTFEIMPGTK